MKVEINDLMPDNFFAFVPATGGFVPHDRERNFFGKLVNDEAKEYDSKVYDRKFASVSQHAADLAKFEFAEADLLLDMPHFMDEIREARLRAFEEQFLGKTISTANIAPKPEQSLSPDDILSDIIAIYEKLAAEQMVRDMDMIRTFLECGFPVEISEGRDRPTLSLPGSYRKAYNAVIKEQIAERLGNLNRRSTGQSAA